MKGFINYLRGKAVHVMVAMTVFCMMAVPAFAEEGDTVGTVMTSTATSIMTDLKSMVTTILPIALGLFTLVVGIKFGIKFIKQLIGKAG